MLTLSEAYCTLISGGVVSLLLARRATPGIIVRVLSATLPCIIPWEFDPKIAIRLQFQAAGSSESPYTSFAAPVTVVIAE
jgi:hypothetical protein